MSKSTKFKPNYSATRDPDRKTVPRKETPIKQQISAVGDIPLLELSGRNYPLWEEKLYNYSVRTFGDIARTIKTRTAFVPPQVAVPEEMPEIAGTAIEREAAIHHPLRVAYNQEIQERVKIVKRNKELKPASMVLFGTRSRWNRNKGSKKWKTLTRKSLTSST